MTRKSFRRVPISIALGTSFLLAACGHMPVTSMVKLARIDFATVDPAELRVAVKLPQSVLPRRGGVRLRITVKTRSSPPQTEEFVLRDLNDAGELMALRAEVEPGTAIYAFRLDPDDGARVQSFRAAALRRQAGGGGASLTLGVGAEACRLGEVADQPIYLTAYLKTQPAGDYIPLMRNVDLRAELSRMAAVGAAGVGLAPKLPPCG